MKKIILSIIFAMAAGFSANAQYEWAKNIGGYLGVVTTMTTDASGNVYVAGHFTGTADFDPGPGTANLTAAGQDAFFAKYTSTGAYVWAKKIGGNSLDAVNAITLRANGDIYLTGYFWGTANFNPAGTNNLTSSGNNDIFFARYNNDGVYQWAHRIGGTAYDEGTAIAVDASGNVYISGYFTGSAVNFNTSGGTNNLDCGNGAAPFFAKYNTAGAHQWSRAITGNGDSKSHAMHRDALGNIYIAGYFSGSSTDFDPGSGVINFSAAGYDAFFAKYNSNGDYMTAKAFGGNGDDRALSIGIDASSNFYVTGYFNGTADFDPNAGVANIVSSGGEDIFVAKYNANGSYNWAKGIGGTGSDRGHSINIDAIGSVFISGYFNQTAEFNPVPLSSDLSSGGGSDIFFAKYATDGSYLWAKNFGNSGSDIANTILTDASGNIYLGGTFSGITNFDPGSTTAELNAATGGTGFFAKYTQTGVLPLTLLDFTVRKNKAGVAELIWETINEKNVSHIIVERSADGKIYNNIAQVKAFNRSENNHYKVIDEKPEQGGNYYRLKIVDFDGQFEISQVRLLNFNNTNNSMNAYPNPAQNTININASNTVQISIIDAMGKTVKSQQIEVGHNSIDISSLSKGIYILQNRGGDNTKFIKE